MLEIYAEFAEYMMAMPVIKGEKTASERFAGAENTFTIEAMMQDGKALQAGTSHFLGQNFAKAFEVTFLNEANQSEYVWATSWGVSTRLMGALIMTHSDDQGLVLPPRLAPLQVVIVPIPKGDEVINAAAAGIMADLRAKGITVKYDDDPRNRPGFKFAEYEMRGVPVRLALGKRDLENGTIEVARRDTGEKQSLPLVDIATQVEALLEDIQNNLYQKAKARLEQSITKVDTWEEFVEVIEHKGGFAYAHWDGTAETEERIKELTKATSRCIPFEPLLDAQGPGQCVLTGKPSERRILFAKAY
jgi:prolyl-tRNA synthetase